MRYYTMLISFRPSTINQVIRTWYSAKPLLKPLQS